MKLIAFLLLLLTISSTNQICAEGCLKCDSNSNCTVADLSKGFVLSNNSAIKSTQTNCLILNADGTCASCNAGYYLDSTAKCVAVPTASAIANCSYYSSATSCRLCVAGFYLNNNVCTAVTATIANCAAYANATTCAACSNNYILSLDLTSCVSVSAVSNCSGYSFVTCASCASGYHLNRNSYLTSNLAAATSANLLNLAVYARSVIGASSTANATVCATNANTNCTTFAVDSDACTLCNSGYFLDTAGVCNLYPIEPIPSCAVYNNATSCASCVSGYTLNNNVCTAIANASLIANCATYNTAVANVTCTACTSTYYLSNNACVARVDSLNIANCATVSVTTDQCATCATGYTKSTNNLFCLANIANCASYQIPNANGTLQCTACNSTYTIQAGVNGAQNSCIAITIANCASLNANDATKCGVCVNTFSLSQTGTCVAQTVQTNCSIYSQTAGVCSTCNPANSFVTTLVKSCQTVTAPIANCAVYGGTPSAPTCTTCATNYFLSNNACTAFTITGCIAGNNTACAQCASGSVLNYNSSACIAPYTYITDQCLTNSSTAVAPANAPSATNVLCSICKQGAIPFNYSGHYACLSLAEAKDKNGGTDLSSNYTTSCLKVDSNMQCVQCDASTTNKYLNSTTANGVTTTSCVSSCANGVMLYTLNSTGQIQSYNVCMTSAPVANCGVYAYNLAAVASGFTTTPVICIKCAATFFAFITGNMTAYSNADPNVTAGVNATYQVNFIPSPYARYPGITTCSAINDQVTIAGAPATNTLLSDLTANCEIFLRAANGGSPDYSCLKCNFGYTGLINGNNLISKCEAINNCSTTKYYNLNAQINNLASCHACTDSGSIPIVAYSTTVGNAADNTGTLAFNRYWQYTFSANNAAFTTGTSDRSVVCRPATTSPQGVTSWAITANCGIGAILINNSANNNAPTIGNYCAACKPGFVSASNTENKTNCTAIANCPTTGTLFNGCSACNANYILAYSSGNIVFTQCLPASTNASNFTNCYAANSDANGNATTCAVCKPGYNLNDDFICEAITPINCAAQSFKTSVTASQTALDWSLFANGNAIGCNKCNTGNISALVNTSTFVCVPSAYVVNTVDNMTTSVYVEHCKNYLINNNGVYKCAACQTNFVLSKSATNTSDATSCYANTNLANCARASTTSICDTCISDLFSISPTGVCTAGAIANCAAYENTLTNAVANQKCNKCNPDYYLTSSNTCALGIVRNCQLFDYNSAISCASCVTGYTLIVTSGQLADICVPNPTVTNCAATGIALSPNGLDCNSCASPTTQVVASLPANSVTTACLTFGPVANCATYNTGTIVANDYTCTVCATGFYLKDNRCIARTTIAKCTTYVANDDSCAVCDSTSFLAANAKACTTNPAGVYKCATYSNATTCTSCRSGFYLASNTCTAIVNAIANCAAYSNATTCSACATGYALTNNTCVSATAQNCATYTSASACATCNQGYVLTTSNGVTSCTTLTKTGCATIDANPPNNCLSCNTSFYLSNGACVAATATIARCTVFASATTCSQCDAGYVLSVDKTACVNTAAVVAYNDANCNNSQAVASPACSRCGAGRYFVNGACTGTCTITGCLACSPSNNAVCYICNTGYYQDSTGKCVAVASGTVTPSSASNLVGVLSAFAIMIAVMFK